MHNTLAQCLTMPYHRKTGYMHVICGGGYMHNTLAQCLTMPYNIMQMYMFIWIYVLINIS
jgi:hypothetical protein